MIRNFWVSSILGSDSMNKRILIVDDEAGVRTLLKDVFEGGGFETRVANGWSEAKAILNREEIDLVTLDLQLGSENGLDVARRIRAASPVPIIMITGRDDVVDRVVGLELGADDYITKPFHVREVQARVRSVLRRSAADKKEETAHPDEPCEGAAQTSPAFEFDGLVAVPERLELFDRKGELCETTSGDFKLLNIFLENAKRVMSRDRLMDLIGGVEWSPLDRTIDNQVARLRKKIERNPADPRIIKTVRGVGYSFTSDITRIQSDERPKSSDRRRASSR